MLHALFAVPLLPLVGFLVLVAAGRKLGDPLAGWVGTVAVAASFFVTLGVFISLALEPVPSRSFTQDLFTWFQVGGLQVKVGFLTDQLSMTMALFVTGVSALIHLYSIGYMGRDRDFPKFFVYLNLFVFSMLVLVLADNFVFSFLGWEGVGLCSYLLIAFWFERESAASAGQKAFVFNRIGDIGFLLAMFLMFGTVGTLSYSGVFSRLGGVSSGTATAIALLLFLGAVGKSAQIPLFTWLPDAMEGPTPVSALIHAATMVTAGVYLMCRINPILAHTGVSLNVVAVVGVVTAFVAATIACAQDDIKRVLAYSTVSQLGYMFLAVGCRAYTAAIFLMVAHAFYKGLLFLSAGSVIHGLKGEQNLKLMGGLRRYLPITYICFLIGWLSIAGVPPFSGFWAKGDVLVNAYAKSPALWVVGIVTAVLTAYYMGREFFLAWWGEERFRETGGPFASGGDPHEPPVVMWAPVVVLAFFAAVGGLLNLPFASIEFLNRWLEPVFGANLFQNHLSAGADVALETGDALLAVAGAAIAGGAAAAGLWGQRVDRPSLEPAFLRKGWAIDSTYDRLLGRPATAMSAVTSAVLESRIIDGAVNGLATTVRMGGAQLRRLQTGYVRNYALGVSAGIVALLAYLLTRAGS